MDCRDAKTEENNPLRLPSSAFLGVMTVSPQRPKLPNHATRTALPRCSEWRTASGCACACTVECRRTLTTEAERPPRGLAGRKLTDQGRQACLRICFLIPASPPLENGVTTARTAGQCQGQPDLWRQSGAAGSWTVRITRGPMPVRSAPAAGDSQCDQTLSSTASRPAGSPCAVAPSAVRA